MNRHIYKYRIGSLVPEFHTVLHVAMQDGEPTIWLEVNPSDPDVANPFYLVPTGSVVTPGDTYIGTILDGPCVWHVYEVQS